MCGVTTVAWETDTNLTFVNQQNRVNNYVAHIYGPGAAVVHDNMVELNGNFDPPELDTLFSGPSETDQFCTHPGESLLDPLTAGVFEGVLLAEPDHFDDCSLMGQANNIHSGLGGLLAGNPPN